MEGQIDDQCLFLGQVVGKCWKRLCKTLRLCPDLCIARNMQTYNTQWHKIYLPFLRSPVAKNLIHGQISFHTVVESFSPQSLFFLQALAPSLCLMQLVLLCKPPHVARSFCVIRLSLSPSVILRVWASTLVLLLSFMPIRRCSQIRKCLPRRATFSWYPAHKFCM